MDDVRIWAEAGEWTRGEPALVVMRGQYDCGQLIDAPEVLHDVPLDHADEWDDALAALGYRKVPESREVATEYGVAFDIEAF
jgi:hypothetical protein